MTKKAKILIGIILVLIIIIGTACFFIFKSRGRKQVTHGRYKDGIYTEEGNERDNGNENATVVIKNGNIVKITLRRLDNIGREVEYEDWTGNDKKPNLKEFRQNLSEKMLQEQSAEVDSISGATVSSANWKLAVSKALEKASKKSE